MVNVLDRLLLIAKFMIQTIILYAQLAMTDLNWMQQQINVNLSVIKTV